MPTILKYNLFTHGKIVVFQPLELDPQLVQRVQVGIDKMPAGMISKRNEKFNKNFTFGLYKERGNSRIHVLQGKTIRSPELITLCIGLDIDKKGSAFVAPYIIDNKPHGLAFDSDEEANFVKEGINEVLVDFLLKNGIVNYGSAFGRLPQSSFDDISWNILGSVGRT